MMSKEEILRHLEVWSAQHKANRAAYDGLKAVLNISPENQIFDAIFFTFDEYTNALEMAFGIAGHGWLSWFCGDNEMGANAFEATPRSGFKSRKVKTLKDLAKLIVEARE